MILIVDLIYCVNKTSAYLIVLNKLRLIKKCYQPNVFTNHIYLIYMYKEDLTLDNLQWLICHQTKPYIFDIYV